jgi:ribosomal protein S18 acetylase RimI-like enzyme
MSDIIIRDADLARDRAALERFILGSNTYEAQFESDRRLDAKAGADFLPELIERAAAKQGRVFVAEEAGVPIGWAVCYVNQHDTFVRVEERPYGYVSELFVEEAARGRHVGRKLLNACEDYFRSLKVASVLIGALTANTRAVKAYKAAGYADYDVNLRKVL